MSETMTMLSLYRFAPALAAICVLVACSGSGSGSSSSAGMGNTEVPGGPMSYTTNFPLTENPISEGGVWVNGKAVGVDWSDVSKTPGLAVGRQFGANFTDATALLTGTWGPDQSATATIHTVNQTDVCFQETTLRLRSTISAHVNSGYEITFKMSQSSQAYLIIVRWNGPVGSFDYLFNTVGSQFAVQDGDMMSAKIVGNTITATLNGVVKGSADITSVVGAVFTGGNPGLGFSIDNSTPACRGTNGDYGFTNFSATDTP